VSVRVLWLICLAMAACTTADPGLPAPTLVSAQAPYPPGSLAPLRQPGARSDRVASYVLDVRHDAERQQLVGSARLTFINRGGQPVTELPFHLYLNAFKNEGTLFMRESGGLFRDRPIPEDGWGWIEVSSIQIDGAERRAAATLGPPGDDTVLTVPLALPVDPGAQVVVTLTFTAQLPRLFSRTGFEGDFVLAGQWYPKLGVLEHDDTGQRWVCTPFHAAAEFYADFGVYDVTLDLRDDLVVAATGVLVAREPAGAGRVRLRYRAEDVHDFAWMADPHMQVARARSPGGVEILHYFQPAQAAYAPRHLAAAAAALDHYSRHYGDYPYTVMTVIDPPRAVNDTAGGMEYPTLVTTCDDAYWTVAGIHKPEWVTVHEVGHNWFQGLVATDEGHHTWLDEGINEYTNGLMMAEWKGEGREFADLAGLASDYFQVHRLDWDGTRQPSPASAAAWQFPSAATWAEASYMHPALVLRTLEGMVGRRQLQAAIGAYAREFAFRHPRPADFQWVLERELGRDLDWFLGPALGQRGSVELAVLEVQAHPADAPRGVFGEGASRQERKGDPGERPLETTVLVTNTGTVPIEVDVEARYQDRAPVRRRFDNHGAWQALLFPDEPIEIVIDPDRRVLLERYQLDNSWSARPGRGAWQAASASGDLFQTVLSAVGP
jgi:hypothetical protein